MNKTFKIVSALALSAVIAIGLGSCANDNVPDTKKPDEKKEQKPDEKPEEKPEETGEAPQKVVLKFAQGHFHSGAAFHQSSFDPTLQHVKSEVVFTYRKQGDDWVLTDDSPKTMFIEATGYQDEFILPYGMWISYFDKDGAEITGDFVQNGMDTKCQHFFGISNVKDLDDNELTGDKAKITTLFEYVYMDSDPWDKQIKQGAKRVGSKLIKDVNGIPTFEPLNPTGMKGYFNFIPDSVKFDLKIDFLYMADGKFTDGKPHAFHNPKVGAKPLASLTLPIVVFVTREDFSAFYLEGDDAETDVESYDDLSAPGKALVDHIAKTFGMPREQAFRELHSRINKPSPDTSTLYF